MIVQDHIRGVTQLTGAMQPSQIFNMDETPCYFDMTSERTLDFKGADAVDAANTGNDKSWFTVVLCSSADGRMLKTLVILKGLKNVPKCSIPANIYLCVSQGGSMTEDVMKIWITNCFQNRGPYMANQPGLLFMDHHKSHLADSVIERLKNLNVKVKPIPPKMTSFLQPLDVSGGPNGVFKRNLRHQWQDWFENGPKEYTPKGNRRRPSYGAILQMVSDAVAALGETIIKQSFELCSITALAASQPVSYLNARLRGILGYEEGLDIEDSDDPFSDQSDDELDVQK